MSNKIIGYIIQCNINNSIYYIGKKREIYFSSLGSKVKIFKSKNGIKSAINKLQQLNPNYNYKIKNIYRTTKISSYYYYKEQIVQNNKSILMLGNNKNNKQGINNNIHDKRIVLLKK